VSTSQQRTCLLLDGRNDDEPAAVAAHGALRDELTVAGWAVDDWCLRDTPIAWCSGCFGCWVKTPGVCAHRDAGRNVAARILSSDLLVLLTPVTFGGYSGQIKKALDHIIPISLPYLRAQGGGTRHPKRYQMTRDLLVVGVSAPGCDAEAEAATLRRLVARNALNMLPPRWAVGVVAPEAGEWEVRVTVNQLLAEVGATARGAALAVALPGVAADGVLGEVAS
jgi:multimeric flavodoxin WrbA